MGRPCPAQPSCQRQPGTELQLEVSSTASPSLPARTASEQGVLLARPAHARPVSSWLATGVSPGMTPVSKGARLGRDLSSVVGLEWAQPGRKSFK